MAENKLHRLLKRVRTRLLVLGSSTGALWGLIAATCLLVVGMWLDLVWELSPQLRITAGTVAILMIPFATVLLITKSLRDSRDAVAVRRLDQAGHCGGAVVSGWELSSPRSDARHADRQLTAGLASLAVDQAARLAEKVPTSRIVSSRPLRVAATSVFILAAILSMLIFSMPALARVQWQRFANPYSDLPPFSLVQFQIAPGDAEVIYGNPLEIRATITGVPVEAAELVVLDQQQTEEVIPMFAESSDVWRATLARVEEPAVYFVRAERSRSSRFNIGVITVPQVTDVRFEITQPDYTREPPYRGPLPKDGIAGLTGTRIRVLATSNRPLSGGSVDVTSDGETTSVKMAPTATSSNEVTAEFKIQNSGKFILSVVDTDGQRSQAPFHGTITRLADERPFARLLQPRVMSLATPEANLPVTIEAEDDFGVGRVQLYRSLNNSRPRPLDLKIESPAPRRMQDTIYLSLSEYGLSPGDEIKLFARVEDNDPAGAKGGESTVATVRIISQEDFERMLRARRGLQVLISKYQQAQRRIENISEQIRALQEKIAEFSPDSPASDKLREELQKLTKQMQQEVDAIQESAKHLLPYDFDKNLRDTLQQLARSLQDATKSLAAAESRLEMNHKQLSDELAKVAEQLSNASRKYKQEATEPLQHLALIYPLFEDQSKFVHLVMRQRDLAERMAALKGHDGEDNPVLKARMRDLEEEQRKIRDELGTLLVDIEEHVTRLPEDPRLDDLRSSATEFVAAVRASAADQAMSDAETALAEFAGTRAFENATEAADILEEFLNQCQGMGEACKSCLKFSPGLANGLGNTLQQLLSDAGLQSGTGFGLGEGAGGGYSARSSNMNNVGLYGGLPALGPQGSGTGTGDFNSGPGRGGSTSGRLSHDPTMVEATTTGDSSGGGRNSIPLRYRQRVGQYLQRLAEELDQ